MLMNHILILMYSIQFNFVFINRDYNIIRHNIIYQYKIEETFFIRIKNLKSEITTTVLNLIRNS